MTLINIEKKEHTNEYNNVSNTSNTTRYSSCRPLKHWRKVLCSDVNCNIITQEIIKDKSNECGDCNPKKLLIRSGLTEKLINPTNNEPAKIKYNYSNLTYLKSKCSTYEQLLTGISNDVNDKTKRSTLECATGCNNNNSINFTYKPNNEKFSQQGAVSSSSRIHRLKYDTITNNAASFKSAYGSSAANAGKYRTYGGSPYFIKSKIDNNCNNRPLMGYRQKSQVCN